MEAQLETLNWMCLSNPVEGFLNVALSLIHPDLFCCGLDMLKELRKRDGSRQIANEWQLVFTGIVVIVN